VQQRQNRVTNKHSRTGIPHNLLDPSPHERLKTMNRTCGARRFLLPKAAPVQAAESVFEQRRAVAAQSVGRPVMGVAENIDHRRDSTSFANNPSRL
jgi:hypothetical protein